MSPKDPSSQSFSLLRFIVKCVIAIVVIAIFLALAAIFVLPSLISSDFGRNKAVEVLARELQRPVSIDTLSFSWKNGVAVSGLTVTNQDQSPLLALNDFKVTISWPDLLARKISVQTLTIDGITVTLTRDASGKTNISDLLETQAKATPAKKKPKRPPKEIPALFLDAHLKNGNFIFIDQRLDTTTRIQNLRADVSVRSLSEPIELLLNGEIVVNEKSPDQLGITGLVHLAPEGRIDPRKAQGKMEMKSGFGSFNAVFDLAKFDTTGEATGASLSCFIDLKKLGELGAGIFGFPPDFAMQGQVTSNLKARGNLQSQIAIQGDTRLSNLALIGGAFKDAPLQQPQIDFVQDITINYAKDTVEIGSFDLKSGFFNLAASGSVSDFQRDPTYALQLKGGGNLRELTRVLGKPLALPSDVKITGVMNFAFSATGPQSTLHVKGRTTLKDLTINAPSLEGRPFQEGSLEVTPDCLINVPQKSLKITSLRLQSELLNGDLEGTLESDQSIDMKVRLSAALGNLKKQLPNLLPPTFPSQGKLSSQVTLQGNLDQSVSFKGNHSLEGTVIVLPPASEDQKSPAPVALPKVTVNHDLLYVAAQDTLTVTQLKADSPFLNFEGSGTLSQISKNQFTKCQGNLALDLTEMNPLLNGLFPEKLSAKGKGALSFACEGSLSPPADKPVFSSWNGNGSLSLDSIDYQGFGTIKDLRSTQLTLEKGILRFALACLLNGGPSQFQGTLDLGSSKITKITSLRLQSELLSGDLEGTLESDQSIDMKLRLSAALGNLKKQLPSLLPPRFPSQGQFSSQVTLQGNLEKSLSLKGDHAIEGAVVTPMPASKDQKPPSPIAIPKLTVTHDLLYAAAQDNLTVTKLKASSPFLNFEGSGTLSQISKNQLAKCRGNLALDLTEMNPLLKTFFSGKLVSKGKGALTFSGEGNLKSPDDKPLLSSWNGKGSLLLDSIDYQGLGTIKNLRSTQFSLEKGLLRSVLECLLNDGPAQFQGTFDFRSPKPDMKVSLAGKEVQVSQDLDLLGYVVPILITSPSGKLSGEGNFSVQAAWKGIDWDSEISKTITGKGNLNLEDGILKSEAVLSVILRSFGKPETLEFEEILADFRLGEGKLFNDNIRVNGKDLKFGLRGWTALAYDPSQNGNPMDYTVTGDFLKKSIGKDGEKVLAILGGGEPTIPVGIGGTVQKPKVSIKMPKAGDLLRGLLPPPQ